MKFETETQLAAVVVQHYTNRGWRVGQEVFVKPYPEIGIIDVLAQQYQEMIAIAVKRSFGFAVVEQAYRLVPFVHRSFIAVPDVEDTESRGWQYARATCRRDNIGILIVNERGVSELEVPRRCSEPRVIGIEILDEHVASPGKPAFSPAGSASGRYFTKAQALADDLVALVTENPGRKIGRYMDELNVQGIARAQLEHWSKRTPRLRAKKMSGLYFLYGPEGSE